MKKSGTSHFI